nr:hypothetical protein [Nanoarchaeum sp.]
MESDRFYSPFDTDRTWRTHIQLASVYAQFGNIGRMVHSLEQAVNSRIAEVSNKQELEVKAGYAFCDLAKRLDASNNKEMARRTLELSLDHYKRSGLKRKTRGITFDELKDYIDDPNSTVSINNLEIITTN